MKRWKLVMVGFSVLVVSSSCVLMSFFPSSPLGPGLLPVTPEAAARANSPCGALNPLQDFRVLDTRLTPHGKLVTFTVECFPVGPGGPIPYLGYSYMQEEEDGVFWSDLGGSGHGGEWVLEDLVSINMGYAVGETIVFGYSLSPQVVAMEAVFNNGDMIHDETGNGVFTLQAPGALRACEIRVLGADGKALKTIDLSNRPGRASCSQP